MNHKISAEAEGDILEIYEYTFKRFGERQAESYLEELREHFDLMTDNPLIGRDVGDIRPNVRCSTHASHNIYYRLFEDVLYILRILHKSRDPSRFL